MRFIVIVLLSVVFLYGCNPDLSTKSQEIQDSLTLVKGTYIKRSQQKDFLLMHYWLGMNENEFEVITDSLVRVNELLPDKRLEIYNPNIKFNLWPEFRHDSLIAITLKSSDGHLILNKLIESYKLKYGDYTILKDTNASYFSPGPTFGIYILVAEYIWNRKNNIISITASYTRDYIKHENTIDPSDTITEYSKLALIEITYTTPANFKNFLEKEEIKQEKTKKTKQTEQKELRNKTNRRI